MIDSIVSLIVIAFLIQYPPYLKYSTPLSLSCKYQSKLLFCVSHCSEEFFIAFCTYHVFLWFSLPYFESVMWTYTLIFGWFPKCRFCHNVHSYLSRAGLEIACFCLSIYLHES